MLLLGLFCLSVTSLPTSYSVGSPYSLVYPDYPLTYHTGFAQPYQTTYQTGYQPGYQPSSYHQSGYQASYPAGYQAVVVGLGSPTRHVQFLPTTVTGTRPVLVPLVPVVQQPHRQPLRPGERHDRPLVVHQTQVIRPEEGFGNRHRGPVRNEPEEVIDVIVDRKPVTAE
ncbi:hypothetical protein HPB52_003986 [Rhipicephalus sanguineus]|uniref:Uncharacterized protein n=2 Tax=Rhipicephalus sanguineus TaxID=34632 RepID=A0A9D4PI91_RHISA|nr:hypothetical protein HPB52_003986 [Rhipicephalus sanguineus]